MWRVRSKDRRVADSSGWWGPPPCASPPASHRQLGTTRSARTPADPAVDPMPPATPSAKRARLSTRRTQRALDARVEHPQVRRHAGAEPRRAWGPCGPRERAWSAPGGRCRAADGPARPSAPRALADGTRRRIAHKAPGSPKGAGRRCRRNRHGPGALTRGKVARCHTISPPPLRARLRVEWISQGAAIGSF